MTSGGAMLGTLTPPLPPDVQASPAYAALSGPARLLLLQRDQGRARRAGRACCSIHQQRPARRHRHLPARLCDHRDALVPGKRGVLLCVALDQRVAKITLDYAEAWFERSPILKQLIANRTADALELTNGITLEVRPASFRNAWPHVHRRHRRRVGLLVRGRGLRQPGRRDPERR